MNIGEIKSIFKNIEADDRAALESFVSEFSKDERGGVISIVSSAKKKIEAYDKETKRTEKMYSFEEKYTEQG